MESLLRCEACRHGATAHDPAGCTIAGCRCPKSSERLVDEALEAARGDIRRDWQITT